MGKAVISLTTGLEDAEKVTVALLTALGAAEAGRPTLIFLTKEAVRLALRGAAKGIACDEFTAVCIDTNGSAAVYGSFPASDDHAYFIQTNCEITERNPETCTSGTPLTWNRNGTALRVYKIKGTQNGANKFRLSDWKTGNGGVWEQWYVQGGVLLESAGSPINCQATSSENSTQPESQLRIYPNPGSEALMIEAPYPIRKVQVSTYAAQIVYSSAGAGSGSYLLNTENLSTGIYLLKIYTDGGEFVRQWVKK